MANAFSALVQLNLCLSHVFTHSGTHKCLTQTAGSLVEHTDVAQHLPHNHHRKMSGELKPTTGFHFAHVYFCCWFLKQDGSKPLSKPSPPHPHQWPDWERCLSSRRRVSGRSFTGQINRWGARRQRTCAEINNSSSSCYSTECAGFIKSTKDNISHLWNFNE